MVRRLLRPQGQGQRGLRRRLEVVDERDLNDRGRHLFEQIDPFAAESRTAVGEAGNVPPGRIKFGTKPCATGSETSVNTIGMSLVARWRASRFAVVALSNTSGLNRPTRSEAQADKTRVDRTPVYFDLYVFPVVPSELSIVPGGNPSERFVRLLTSRLARRGA